MKTSPLLVCLAGALGAAPSPALAACLTPAPTVVWSYPSEGQTDVPTNLAVWLLLSNGHTPDVVFIDDEPVPANMLGFGFEPPQPLTPNSLHVLSFLATPEDAELPVQLSLRFTTGPGPADELPPEAPFITAVTNPTMRNLAPRCQQAVQAMACQEKDPDTHLVFANSSRPLLWIVERLPAVENEPAFYTLWPGDCGLPELFTGPGARSACDHHFRLHALGPTGLRATGKPVCPSQLLGARPGGDDGGAPADDPDGSAPPLPEEGSAPMSPDAGPRGPAPRGSGVQVHESGGDVVGGCALGGARPPAGVLLALLLIVALRRRRPR
jgi:hypothetical protein